MTVKARVRNRKAGVSVNVEINNKSEANNHSKNRYIPELQSNIDDQEPPSQASIQNIIPYMNKAPSLPMYNSGDIGIPSRYGNMAPQGSTNVPQGYQLGNDMNQPAIPSEYDFLDAGNEDAMLDEANDSYYIDMPELPKKEDSDLAKPNVSQPAELFAEKNDISEIQPIEEEDDDGRNFSLQLSDIFVSEKSRAHYERLKSDRSKKNYEERFKDYLRRLVKSFQDPSKKLSKDIIKTYDLYPDIRHELASSARHNPESRKYYSDILKRYDSKP